MGLRRERIALPILVQKSDLGLKEPFIVAGGPYSKGTWSRRKLAVKACLSRNTWQARAQLAVPRLIQRALCLQGPLRAHVRKGSSINTVCKGQNIAALISQRTQGPRWGSGPASPKHGNLAFERTAEAGRPLSPSICPFSFQNFLTFP